MIALLGYYGFGNLGDELLLRSCLEMFGRERIIVLSNSPEETSRTFGVEAVNRWSFREVLSAFRRSNALVLGGGGLFQDSTSLKSCVWYWGVVRLAGVLGCRVYALGQSVGPLKSRVSRYFAGNALKRCVKLHVRDEASRVLAESLGCRDVMLGADLVMTLSPSHTKTAMTFPQQQEQKTLPQKPAMQLPTQQPTMPYKKVYESDYMLVNLRPCPELEHYREIIAPHVDADSIGAALAEEDVNALEPLGLSRIVRVKTLDDARELWGGASCAVGMRLHFGGLSRMFRTPLALMPYDMKVSEFARTSGVPCIVDKWTSPVMPREVESDAQIDAVCREIISL